VSSGLKHSDLAGLGLRVVGTRLVKVEPGATPAELPSSAGRRVTHAAGVMNKTERRFAQRLELMRRGGQIRWYKFEPFRLILAPRTTYKPDFLVVELDGSHTLYEVKGHWEDDARVKIKWAAQDFPCYRVVAVQWRKGEWVYEHIPAPAMGNAPAANNLVDVDDPHQMFLYGEKSDGRHGEDPSHRG
jgi:hypothetical protein